MTHEQLEQIQSFLFDLISQRAPEEGLDWLSSRLEEIQQTKKDRTFYLTFSAMPRYLGKDKLLLELAHMKRAGQLREGFHPLDWTVDRAARVWLLLHLPHDKTTDFIRKMEMLFSTADMGELEALYSSLPLIPYPQHFVKRAAEGIRTNMTNVFDAIALDNPYPAEYLDQGAWNQLVLKAAFMDRPLYRIYGLEKRANSELAQIISDYAHERWAAGRVVSPEFWRPVGPFVTDSIVEDLRRLFQEEHPLQREAAALVCAESEHPEANKLLDEHPAIKQKIEEGKSSWEQLSRTWWEEKSSRQ